MYEWCPKPLKTPLYLKNYKGLREFRVCQLIVPWLIKTGESSCLLLQSICCDAINLRDSENSITQLWASESEKGDNSLVLLWKYFWSHRPWNGPRNPHAFGDHAFFFFWSTPQHMEFPGQGSDPSCSCSCSHAGSLNHCAGWGIEPAPLHCRDTANHLVPQWELLDYALITVA